MRRKDWEEELLLTCKLLKPPLTTSLETELELPSSLVTPVEILLERKLILKGALVDEGLYEKY